MKIITVILIFVACFADTFIPVDPQPHKCQYENCLYKDQLYFTGGVECCTQLCNSFDSLHFEYPNVDYDSLETILSTINTH